MQQTISPLGRQVSVIMQAFPKKKTANIQLNMVLEVNESS